MQSVCTGHGDDGITGGYALQRIIHSGTHELHVSAPEIVGFFANALLKIGMLRHIRGQSLYRVEIIFCITDTHHKISRLWD